jgi:hypothetical protein
MKKKTSKSKTTSSLICGINVRFIGVAIPEETNPEGE